MKEKILFTFKVKVSGKDSLKKQLPFPILLLLWDRKWILQIFTSWEVSLKKVKIVVESLDHKS